MMTFSFLLLANTSVLNFHCRLDVASACFSATGIDLGQRATSIAADELIRSSFSPALMTALTMTMTIQFVVSFLMPLASRDIARPEWDLEWLLTLPITRSNLLLARLQERTLINPTGWIALWPLATMIAWYSGHGAWSPLLAMLCVPALLILCALFCTILDTGLRVRLAPSRLRNVQAVATVSSLLLMYSAMSFGMPAGSSFTFEWVHHFPEWGRYFPPGLVAQALSSQSLQQAYPAIGALLLEVIVTMAFGLQLLHYQLRDGVASGGARETARQSTRPLTDHANRRRWTFGTVVQRRELRLLSRDRNFLLQTVLMPLIIVGAQLVFHSGANRIAQLGANAVTMATVAFGIGSYMLMLSAFQTLNTEGESLWLLYTFPRALERVLLEKAALWAGLSLLYPAAVFAIGVTFSGAAPLKTLGLIVVALIGIPIYAVIAVSLGVFGCNPLAQETQSRVRPLFLYLYMSLSGLYGYALYNDAWSTRLVLIVLLAGFALALWQKARDHLPYLLDPVAAPAAQVSSADGLIAAVIFFVAQGLFGYFFRELLDADALTSSVLAFACAGGLTWALVRLVFWRAQTIGVPIIFGAAWRDALRTALPAALIASLFGFGYLEALRHWALLTAAGVLGQWTTARQSELLALAVVAAPLFEEFIFRGLIFGGLRRTLPAVPATVLSAAIFAVVHPPQSMLPVFILGVCAAWSYERSKLLLAPVLVHALYNALVVGSQLT